MAGQGPVPRRPGPPAADPRPRPGHPAGPPAAAGAPCRLHARPAGHPRSPAGPGRRDRRRGGPGRPGRRHHLPRAGPTGGLPAAPPPREARRWDGRHGGLRGFRGGRRHGGVPRPGPGRRGSPRPVPRGVGGARRAPAPEGGGHRGEAHPESDHARLRPERGPRPGPLRPDGAVRHHRVRGDLVGRRGDPRADGRGGGPGGGTGRRAVGRRAGGPGRRGPPARRSEPVQPRRGAGWGAGPGRRPVGPQAPVDEGAAGHRSRLPAGALPAAPAAADHGVRGGGLPQHPGVLERRHGHLHDQRRTLHQGVRVLPRRHPPSRPRRPRRAPSGGRGGRRDGPVPRGGHRGGPRRHGRPRCRRLRGDHRVDPGGRPVGGRRGADPRLPW